MIPENSLSTTASATALPQAAAEVLEAFHRSSGAAVCVWRPTEQGWEVLYEVGDRAPAGGPRPDAIEVDGGRGIRIEISEAASPAAVDSSFLAVTLSRLLRLDEEARHIGREISERYEEITLLYTISEILGSVISLEEAADTILREVTLALGVTRASLWIRDESGESLELIASVGGGVQEGPIAASDRSSATAAVFRTRRALILEADEEYPREMAVREMTMRDASSRGSFLSVPVSYTPPEGRTRTIGVINLIGRESGEGFSAGDQKLVAAIASQVGAAMENSRLVAESLRQERLEREMELAHDLQLKLLPSVEQFHGYADVAARCAPANSVGGDFYQLFRLTDDRLGVMIGDVSSHGFGAALIMALTMSATASHASEGESPGEVLRRAHQMLIGELESTEMYLTLFYAVIDPAAGTITYSNAGHSHAYTIGESGGATRLDVTDPPFGMIDRADYGEHVVPWDAERDLLFLFTDGLSDALGLGEIRGVERLVSEVCEGRGMPTETLLERVFSIAHGNTSTPPDDRTALLLRF